jgi:DNA polymerase-3 subunit gamma/tau
MLLSQQAELVRLDNHRAVVQVAGNWMGMVQSRVALLEQAIARAVGGSRQLVLESHGGAAPMAAMPAPSTPPPPAPVPAPAVTSSEAQLPPRPLAATPTPASLPPTPTPSAAPAPAPEPDSAAVQRQEPSVLDDKAKRLADFFNGQVLNVDLDP